jgi:hypothetical protein
MSTGVYIMNRISEYSFGPKKLKEGIARKLQIPLEFMAK